MAQIYESNITVTGSYIHTRKVEYLIKLFPSGTTDGSKFTVEITNWTRNVQLFFDQGSTTVIVHRDNGDGTFSTDPNGIPIWVGDYLYETSNQTDISDAGNGFIGQVASIVSGTEGTSVKSFTVSSNNYAQLSSGAKVNAKVLYECQPFNHTTKQNITDYQGSGNKYTHAKFHGLSIHWNSQFNGLPLPAEAETNLQFMFSGMPAMDFSSQKMITLDKQNETHIIGWSSQSRQFSYLTDIYDERSYSSTAPKEQTVLKSIEVTNEPNFMTRGDDTYIGLGPNEKTMYIGYPNIKQFGNDRGSDLVIDSDNLNLDFSVLPSFEQYCLPAASDDHASDASLALNGTDQLIVGYVKNSSYLIKASRTKGVESNFYVGGKIMAMYLDHENNTKIWVLYDGVGNYYVKCIDVKATGAVMDIHENRIYSLQGASTDDLWITPFIKDEVIPSDIIVLSNVDGSGTVNSKNIFISAIDAKYDDSTINVNQKLFGDADNKKAFIWRSADIKSAISPLPATGYTNLSLTNMTPSFTTSPTATNEQADPYWFTYKQEEWSISGASGANGGLIISNAKYDGNGGALKIKQSPAKRGLCLWGQEVDKQSIGLYIGHVANTFSDLNNPTMIYDSYSEGDSENGFTLESVAVGPFIKQDASKNVALGSHIIIWRNSAGHTSGNTSATDSGVKRLVLSSSSATTTNSIIHRQETSGHATSGTDVAQVEFYNDGTNTFNAKHINTTYAFHSGRHYPKGLTFAYNDNILFFDLNTLNSSKLGANVKDGYYFLNTSVTPKSYTPGNELLEGPINTSSQSWNYKTSGGDAFEWISVSFPGSFVMKYLTAGSDDTDAWSTWALSSVIKCSVTHLGANPLDLNNLNMNTNIVTEDDDDADIEQSEDNYYSNFYRLSLLFDGYQETALGETIYTPSTNPSKYGHAITLECLPSHLGPRVSHINVYKSRAWDSNATEPEYDFFLIKSVSLAGAGWVSSTNGYLKYVINDNKGKNFGTYESLTGISPEMTLNTLNYGESEECSGYLFVTDAGNSEISNVGNYIFRSKPGKYSIFNWANEYVALPQKPTALKSYNNLLYAFTSSKIFVINPNNLSIVDKFEGMGCLNADSVISTDFGIFFADTNGVYQHNGRNGNIISNAIYTSDNTSLSSYTWDSISESLKTDPPKLGFDGERKAVVIFFNVTDESASPNKQTYSWVYSVLTKRWDLWSYGIEIDAITQGKYGDILASDGTGVSIFQVARGSGKKGWTYETKKLTAGYDTYEKQFKEIYAEGNTGLAVKYKTGLAHSSWNALSSSSTVTSSDPDYIKGRLNTSHSKSKWLQIQVIDSNGTRELEALGIHLRPLKAKSIKV